jgi:Co/Zn/Cd efflux system component
MPSFFDTNWGDVATLLGFFITILTLQRTKTAAIAAKNAAESTKSEVLRIDTIIEFSAAIEIMAEIKRLHRVKAWQIVSDRYAAVCRSLTSIQKLNPDLGTEQRSVLGGAIVQFRRMENQVDRAGVLNQLDSLDPAKLNKLVSKLEDELRIVLLSIRQAGI